MPKVIPFPLKEADWSRDEPARSPVGQPARSHDAMSAELLARMLVVTQSLEALQRHLTAK